MMVDSRTGFSRYERWSSSKSDMQILGEDTDFKTLDCLSYIFAVVGFQSLRPDSKLILGYSVRAVYYRPSDSLSNSSSSLIKM